jgi:hypothetical protein
MTDSPAEGKLNLNELVEGATGYDEIAISKFFHMQLSQLEENPTTGMRVAMFLHLRRNGSKDQEAYKDAMTMTLKALSDLIDTDAIEDGADGPLGS